MFSKEFEKTIAEYERQWGEAVANPLYDKTLELEDAPFGWYTFTQKGGPWLLHTILWCHENCTGRFRRASKGEDRYHILCFESESDAMHFKMTLE